MPTIEERDTMRAIQNLNKKTKDQTVIDWEQRRYEIAKDLYPFTLDGCRGNIKGAANEAVNYADALIEELKK